MTAAGHDPLAMDGFPEEAFARLSGVDNSHFWFRSRNRLIVWALREYFPGAASMLDVGCGTGTVLNAIRDAFPTMRLVGADVSAEALGIATKRVDAEFVQVEATDLPFKAEFDVVGTFDVLEHIDDDQAALAALAASVRSGGGLIVTVPQHKWLWSPADEYGRHRRRYERDEIETRVRSAGFSILRSTGWVCTLLPLVAASRLRDRRIRTAYDPTRELRPSPFVNRTLQFALDLEGSAIRMGLSLPFGASRLVVARRS